MSEFTESEWAEIGRACARTHLAIDVDGAPVYRASLASMTMVGIGGVNVVKSSDAARSGEPTIGDIRPGRAWRVDIVRSSR